MLNEIIYKLVLVILSFVVHHVPCWVETFKSIFSLDRHFFSCNADFRKFISFQFRKWMYRLLFSHFHFPQDDSIIQLSSQNNSHYEILTSSGVLGLWQPLTNISADNLEYFQFSEITSNCDEAGLVDAAEIWDLDCWLHWF